MTRRNWAASAETLGDLKHKHRSRCRNLLSSIRAGWDASHKPDALSALQEHPELAHSKSAVLDLASEEYYRREQAGEHVDIESYCIQFPFHQSSLRRRLEVHRYLQEELDPPDESKWPAPPEVFCGFELLEEIGQGAIGRVYLAQQSELGNRIVVVKVSKGGTREASFLGRLQHPNVMPVHSIMHDRQTGLTCICMPHLGVATFEDVLDQIRLAENERRSGSVFGATVQRMNGASFLMPGKAWSHLNRQSELNAALTLLAQVADALAYLHANGICHRDLKPSNILLSDDGRPMLLDFNLSVDMAVEDARLGGTLPYMAPEQIRAMLGQSSNAIDFRADVFAMGVILFELLSGELPFGAIAKVESIQEAGRFLLQQQQSGPRLPNLCLKEVDNRVVRIIERCLAFDPADRFESAEDAAAAIRTTLRPVMKARRWMATHRLQTTAAAVVITASLVTPATLVALRPALHELRTSEGLREYQAGRMHAALLSFREATRASPDYTPALVGAARSKLALKKYVEALEDFRKLHERTGDPRFLACAGYCLNLQGEDAKAIAEYMKAIANGRLDAVVLNNLGFSFLNTNSLDNAQEYLERALSLDPFHQPALHNRAILAFTKALYSETHRVPFSAVEDIERAIRLAPGHANMHFLAASLWLLCEHTDGEARFLQHSQRAIELGFDRQGYKKQLELSILKPLVSMKLIDELACVNPQAVHVPDPARFTDPDPAPEELRRL